MSFLDNDPYRDSPMPEPIPHWTARLIQQISDNVWPLLGVLFFATSSGLWLLFALADLFDVAGRGPGAPVVGHVVVTIVEVVLGVVATFVACMVGAVQGDGEDEQRARALLVIAWTHVAVMLLATVAITVFA